jgi:hypothetical protein
MAARVHNVFSLAEILKIFLSETTKSIELWLCRNDHWVTHDKSSHGLWPGELKRNNLRQELKKIYVKTSFNIPLIKDFNLISPSIKFVHRQQREFCWLWLLFQCLLRFARNMLWLITCVYCGPLITFYCETFYFEGFYVHLYIYNVMVYKTNFSLVCFNCVKWYLTLKICEQIW